MPPLLAAAPIAGATGAAVGGGSALAGSLLPAALAAAGGVASGIGAAKAAKTKRNQEVEDRERFVLDDVTKDKDFGARLMEEYNRRNVSGPTLSRGGRPIMFR